MFGLGFKAKPKRKYTKPKPQQSRVDKLISILDEANRKDREEKSSYKPKRKYKKKKSFGIGW